MRRNHRSKCTCQVDVRSAQCHLAAPPKAARESLCFRHEMRHRDVRESNNWGSPEKLRIRRQDSGPDGRRLNLSGHIKVLGTRCTCRAGPFAGLLRYRESYACDLSKRTQFGCAHTAFSVRRRNLSRLRTNFSGCVLLKGPCTPSLRRRLCTCSGVVDHYQPMGCIHGSRQFTLTCAQ